MRLPSTPVSSVTLPEGLRDVSELPNLLRLLRGRGYEIGDLAKLTSGNTLRVWKENERIARELAGGGS